MTIRNRVTRAVERAATGASSMLSRFVPVPVERPGRRPRPGVLVSGTRYDYAPESGKLSLDPEKLGSLLRAADAGDTRGLHEVFSAIEEDPHVHSVLSKRRRAVIARTLAITPIPMRNGQQKAAERASELCNQVIFGDEGETGIEDLTGALYDATDALGRGYSVQQIVWVTRGNLWRPQRLERWPQRDTVLGSVANPYGQDADTVRIVSQFGNWQGEALEPYQWVVHKSKARSDILARSALLRVVAWWYLFKRFSASDWTIFGERYGMPLRVAKYPIGADDRERAALEDAVISLGKDTGVVIPEGTDISFVEAKTSGQLPYERLIQVCNTEISKAILGNTLTTEVGSSGGNRALGEVHERAELDLVEADAVKLAATLREQLLRPIVLFNMGDNMPVPKVDFLSEEERAQKDRAERDQILVRGIGLPIAEDYFYDSYEIPRPEAGQAVIAPPQEHVTATEDMSDEQAAEIDERADEAELTAQDRRAVHALARTLGPDAAIRQVHLLAGSKKKSQAWAL